MTYPRNIYVVEDDDSWGDGGTIYLVFTDREDLSQYANKKIAIYELKEVAVVKTTTLVIPVKEEENGS